MAGVYYLPYIPLMCYRGGWLNDTYLHSRYSFNQWPRMSPRQFPANVVGNFQKSARDVTEVIREMHALAEKIVNDEQFAKNLRGAAQMSQMDEVNRLVRSVATRAKTNVSINPDRLLIEYRPSRAEQCYHLSMTICW